MQLRENVTIDLAGEYDSNNTVQLDRRWADGLLG